MNATCDKHAVKALLLTLTVAWDGKAFTKSLKRLEVMATPRGSLFHVLKATDGSHLPASTKLWGEVLVRSRRNFGKNRNRGIIERSVTPASRAEASSVWFDLVCVPEAFDICEEELHHRAYRRLAAQMELNDHHGRLSPQEKAATVALLKQLEFERCPELPL